MIIRNFKFLISFILGIGCIFGSQTWGSENSDVDSMTLEELMNVKIQGSTKERKSIKQTPAIVTVITAEEIKNMGARDLIDVLNLVPGITLASDTQGTVSIAVRGMWAHEGKVLLVIDGEEMNELSYNTIQLGNHYPVDSIERVEVIRGPGSAVHGGNAELAVINIITKGADELNGVVINGMNGQMGKTTAERNLGVGFGKKIGEWKFSGYTFAGHGTRSDQNYTDQQGSTYNMAGNSNLDPAYVNLGLSNEQWNFRFIYDRYNGTDASAYGVNAPIAVNNNFESILFGTKYDAKLSDSLVLTPEFHFKQTSPWNSTNPESKEISQLYYDVKDQEIRGALSLRAQIQPNLVSYFGIEERMLKSTDYQPAQSFPNGTNEFSYYRSAAFTELNWAPEIASFSAGARYETQNTSGGAFVPRLGAVKQLGDLSLKGIYSWGFRDPGFENLRYSQPGLKPETTKVAEAELGYQYTKNFFSSLSLYDVTLDNPIIFDYKNGSQMYNNSNKAGTYGAEFDTKFRFDSGYFDINYSYFHPKSNEPTEYQIPDHSDSLLGMAKHKAAANINFKVLDDHTRLNVSETYLSTRYGYDYDANSADGLSVKSFNPTWLTNVFVNREDVFNIKGADVGVGVFNLLNQDFRYIQPYEGGHPPLPGETRDWVIKGSYRIQW